MSPHVVCNEESRTQANNLLDMDDIVSVDRREVFEEEGCSETRLWVSKVPLVRRLLKAEI
jgi:hypothetical protein